MREKVFKALTASSSSSQQKLHRTALELSVKEILESFNTFKGTNLNSDLALVSTKVKVLLYIVGLEAGESFDKSMSTCDGVGHITGPLENQ